MSKDGTILLSNGTATAEDDNGSIKLKISINWAFQGDQLRIGTAYSHEVLKPNTTLDSLSIQNMVLEIPEMVITGSIENDIWVFEIPKEFNKWKDLKIVVHVQGFATIDGQSVFIPGEFQFYLTGEKLSAILFQIGHDAFIVIRNEKGEHRSETLSHLQQVANLMKPGEQLFRWEDCKEMTEEHYNNLAILAGVSGLFEGLVTTDAAVGRGWLEEMFKQMDAKEVRFARVQLMSTNIVMSSNIKGAIEFLLPDPGENYRSAQAEADTIFDSSKPPLVRAAAVGGVLGYSILLLVDFIPGAGKADDAVKVMKRGDEWLGRLIGGMELEIKQSKKLAASDKLSQQVRETLANSAAELEAKLESLRKLRDDLNQLDINNIPEEELASLIGTAINLDAARHYADLARREALSDFNEGVIDPAQLALRRTEAAETVHNIMKCLPDHAAKSKLKKIFEDSSSLVSDLDEEAVLLMLRRQGKLTEEGIEKFGRNVRSLYQEVGKVELGEKFKLGPLAETKDLGIEGKRFEEIFMGNTTFEIGQDLNKIKSNFEVVDYVTRVNGKFSKGKIYSIARGTPGYLLEKVRRLFNNLEDAENKGKFRKMLERLSENEVIQKMDTPPSPEQLKVLEEEFLRRAYLLVPSDVADPLKALILSQKNIPIELRERMANAVRSELRR